MTNEVRIDKGYDVSRGGYGESLNVAKVDISNCTVEAVLTSVRKDDGLLVLFGYHNGLGTIIAFGWHLGMAHYSYDVTSLWSVGKRTAASCISTLGVLKYAINGIDDGTHTQNVALNSPNSTVAIGTQHGSTPIGNGYLYSVRAYNRALTQEELAHNYELDRARFNLP